MAYVIGDALFIGDTMFMPDYGSARADFPGGEPPQGVLVFMRDNGVHVDLILPASATGFDLYRLVSPAHIADPESARGWVEFGWGQREFYLETPRWANLTARNAARAVFGGDALMHIENVARPRPSPDTVDLRLLVFGSVIFAVLLHAIADLPQPARSPLPVMMAHRSSLRSAHAPARAVFWQALRPV